MHKIIQKYLVEKSPLEIKPNLKDNEFKLMLPELCKIYKRAIDNIYISHIQFIYTDFEVKYIPAKVKNPSLTRLIFDVCKYGKIIGPKEFNFVLDDILELFKVHDTCFNPHNHNYIHGFGEVKWDKYKPPYINWINAGDDLLVKTESEDRASFLQRLKFKKDPVNIQEVNYEFHTLTTKVSHLDILILISMLNCVNEELVKNRIRGRL